jgi:ABC-type spermidine/putrescine transport system permease subunit II
MAEAAINSAPSRGILYKVRSFLNAKLVNIFAGGLFALLAIFLIYPIISVLVKSFWGDDGFTLDFYVEFFSYNFYYWSLFNTLILGFSTMIILV